MKPVGILGAGTMGLAAGRKILESGQALLVFDVSLGAQEKARTLGADVVTPPAEAARQADVVLLFLPGPKEVEGCVAGKDGLLAGSHPGLVVVDMSTVDPGVTRRMAELALKTGVGYLDAPVLGRPASVGNWALPVGGRQSDLDQCRPVLDLLAAKIFHIGESGSGNKVKLLNQLMFGAINAMTAEMMAVADNVGIPPRLLFEIITASEAATVSNLFKELGGRIAKERYDEPTFSVDLLIKDVRLAVEMAKGHQAPPLLAGTVEFINEMAQAQGYGGFDTSIMWKCYRKIWS
jgi:3-hydroxyisobutyrate dehydrogenase